MQSESDANVASNNLEAMSMKPSPLLEEIQPKTVEKSSSVSVSLARVIIILYYYIHRLRRVLTCFSL
jgi:hypothetical protein